MRQIPLRIGRVRRILAAVRRILVVMALGAVIAGAVIVAPTVAGARGGRPRSRALTQSQELRTRLRSLVVKVFGDGMLQGSLGTPSAVPGASPHRPRQTLRPTSGACYVSAGTCPLTPCRYFVAADSPPDVAVAALQALGGLPRGIRRYVPAASPSGCHSTNPRPTGAIPIVSH
jgi:hypothetical protein